MGKYILKRLVYIVIVFFIVSLLMYALYNLIPGDPAMVEMEPLRKVLKPAEWQRQYLEKRAELGLDRSAYRSLCPLDGLDTGCGWDIERPFAGPVW